MRLYSELSDQQEPTLGLVRETLSIVQSILEGHDQDIQRGYHASIVHEGSTGRPRFDIPRNQLARLLRTGVGLLSLKLLTLPELSGDE